MKLIGNKSFSKVLAFVFLTFLMVSHQQVYAQSEAAGDRPIPVTVGGYIFEPFVTSESQGLSNEMIKALNSFQNTYEFTFRQFPNRRRYEQLTTDKVDMIFFESPDWGWSEYAELIEMSRPFVRISELLVAHSDNAEGVEIFKELEKRRIVIINGYHYVFAEFVNDTVALKERFDITRVDSLEQVLMLIENKRVEVGVLNDIFLEMIYQADPSREQYFIKAQVPDKVYRLPMIVSKSSPLSANELEKMIDGMMASGRLDTIIPAKNMIQSGDE